MSRRRIRQLVIIFVLLALLALISVAYLNYRQTQKLGLDIEINQADLLPAPEYLYSFSGSGTDRLARPLGVLVEDGRVFVTDARRSVVDVFTPEGRRTATWGKGKLAVPLYVARNPKSGEYYVTDRRLRAVVIFDENGKFLRQFDPKLPKDQLPDFETNGAVWAPVALDFAEDGTLYVTEILNGHRLLVFDPQGKFVKSVGTAGLVTDANQGRAAFQFPNSVKVRGQEIWIADSNNRRIQVFDRDGEFKRIIVTQGLPRGFDFLPKRDSEEPARFVVIDTLSHDATIWDAAKGEKELTFGARGVLEGQFSYPNDASIDTRRRIFIADTANGRIQVWGWPAAAAVVPLPTTPLGWLLCLSPLALLPLLLLLRRRRHFATQDFVIALHGAEQLHLLQQRRVVWEMTEEDYEAVKDLVQGELRASDLLETTEFSEADARALQERYELSWRDAAILASAQRARLFGTDDPELRRIARVIEIPVTTGDEFISRFGKAAE